MVSREQVEKEIRHQIGSGYDWLPLSTQQSLVDTHLKSMGHLSQQDRDNPDITAQPVRLRRIDHIPQGYPVRDPQELRQELAAALETRGLLQAEVDKAQAMLTEAGQRLKVCETELQAFDHVDAQIADFDLESLRAGRNDALPAQLSSALASRDKARDKSERMVSLHNRCASEADEVNNKLPDANARVQHLINSIAVAELRILVTDLEAADEIAYELRAKIISLQLSGSSTPGDIISRAFSVPPKVEPSNTHKEQWRIFLKALQTNPDATLDAEQ